LCQIIQVEIKLSSDKKRADIKKNRTNVKTYLYQRIHSPFSTGGFRIAYRTDETSVIGGGCFAWVYDGVHGILCYHGIANGSSCGYDGIASGGHVCGVCKVDVGIASGVRDWEGGRASLACVVRTCFVLIASRAALVVSNVYNVDGSIDGGTCIVSVFCSVDSGIAATHDIRDHIASSDNGIWDSGLLIATIDCVPDGNRGGGSSVGAVGR
jgi:hypothetical protein